MSLHVRTTEAGALQLVTDVDGANVVIFSLPPEAVAQKVAQAKEDGDVVKSSGGSRGKAKVEGEDE